MEDEAVQWHLPPQGLILGRGEVQVWCASLEQAAAAELAQVLSVDEQDRARRFQRERDRLHFVVGRGLLRAILGHYLAIAPQQIQFGYGAYRKPFLVDAPQIQFNVSHSHSLALYAVAIDRLVGIDVEYVQRSLTDLESLAERFFSAGEHAELLALPADQRLAAFLRGWTCKEAHLKAIGTGLAQLDQVEVTLLPDVPARFIRVVPLPSQLSSDWSLHRLCPAPGYVAAIAAQKQPARWCYWQAEWADGNLRTERNVG